jgi:hypothetical protein
MGLIILLLIVFLIIGSLPVWPYSRPYGWYAPGGLAVVLVVVLVLILAGSIPHWGW